MKKIALKKLHLNASTIRQLTMLQLGSVNGGLKQSATDTNTLKCEGGSDNSACMACASITCP